MDKGSPVSILSFGHEKYEILLNNDNHKLKWQNGVFGKCLIELYQLSMRQIYRKLKLAPGHSYFFDNFNTHASPFFKELRYFTLVFMSG